MGEASATEPGVETAPPRRRRRRWPWLLLGLPIALALGIRAALPTLVERGVAWGSRHYLGLPARLDNVDFELLRGRVVLEGLALGARPDGVAPRDAALAPPAIEPANALVQVQRIATRLAWSELRERTLRLTELSVSAPTLRFAREADGKIDPLRYAQPALEPGAEPEPSAAAEPSSPWRFVLERFELRTPDLRVLDVPSGENLAELSFEALTLDQLALQGSAFELGQVGFQGPVLRLRRDLLLAKTAQPLKAPGPPAAPAAEAEAPPAAAEQAPEAAAAPAAPAGGPGYHLAQLDVQRATLTWITEQGPLDVAITLRASDVTAEPGRRFPLDLELEVGDGSLSIVGELGIVPPTYTGKFRWSGIPIPRVLLASLPQFATWLRQANSSGDLQLDADPTGSRGPPALRVAGRLSFDALAVSDPQGNEVTLGWKQLEVVATDVYAPLPQPGQPPGTTKAVLESVRLVEPTIRYTRPSPQLDALLGVNLSGGATLAGTPPAPSAPAPPPVPAETPTLAGAPGEGPLVLEIASLELVQGQVEAIDRTVQPVARTRVRNLSLEAQQVRFPDPAAASMHFRALLPTRAQLDVQGKLAPGNVGDFTLKLQKLDLPVFNPYAGLAGISVDRGTASVDAKLTLRGPKLEIDNRLVLNQFGVSLRDPESFQRQFGMPIDLALALLRDQNGDIALHIPVKVDEKGSRVKLRSIVASALKAALIGAVTAPLKLAGAVFGGGGDADARGFALDPLPSVAGTSALAGEPGPRLDGLVALLAERPALALALHGRTGPEDHPGLAEQLLVERWQQGEDLPALEDTSFLARRRIGRALDARAKGQTPDLGAEDEALYQRYVAAVQVPEERLAALAKARAEQVREQLVTRGAVAARIEIGENESEAQPGVVIGLAPGS